MESGVEMSADAASWDLMVILSGAPFGDESISTALRYVEAVSALGGRVLVWGCGFSTWLTQDGHPDTKPGNAMAWNMDYPSPQKHVAELITRYRDTLTWIACRYCSEERNFTSHIPGVRTRLAMQIGKHTKRSAKVVTVGLT
jgi:hypothetical protein